MKTTKTIVILLALVLLTAAAVQPAEAMVKPKISDTRTASCLVKITSDPAVLPLSDIIINYLLHSSGVAGKAAREVLDISPDQASDLFTIEDVAKYSATLPRSSSRSRTAATRTASSSSARSRTAARPRTPTTTAARTPRPAKTTTTRTPAFPGVADREYDLYYRQPTPGRRTPTTTKSPTPTDEQTYLLKLQVELGEEVLDEPIKPAAEEFMNALIENLHSALNIAFKDYRDKISNQQDLASEEATRAEIKLVKMQKELRNISDYRDLSRNVILNDISNLRTDIQKFEMQNASNLIEMRAITKEIADIEVKIRGKVKNDPITIELQRIVDIQTDSLKRTQELVKEGAVSSAEVDDVLEKLARARIELAKRSEEISKAEGGNRVSQLSSKLAQYTQRMAQYELTLSGKKEQLDEARDFLDRTDNYELLSLKADIARQSLSMALMWFEQIERKARSIQPPSVTVLGGS
jgi:hypothetical protein